MHPFGGHTEYDAGHPHPHGDKMTYEIHVKGNAPATDNAAVLTAFNNLITALRALPGAKSVDAGGTRIGFVRQIADEEDVNKTKLPFGTTF